MVVCGATIICFVNLNTWSSWHLHILRQWWLERHLHSYLEDPPPVWSTSYKGNPYQCHWTLQDFYVEVQGVTDSTALSTRVKGKPLCHPLDSVPRELCGSVRTSGVGLTALPPRTVRSPSSNSAVSQEYPRVIKGNVFCSSLNHESELLISVRFWEKWLYHRKWCFSYQRGYLLEKLRIGWEARVFDLGHAPTAMSPWIRQHCPPW